MSATSTGILTIDCGYLERPEFAAAFLLTGDREAAFIENNTVYAVPKLMQALDSVGLSPEDVRYVMITHVHLDHAGGTSELMRMCPNAKLLAHPKAARHMIDPERLLTSARQVYGAEIFHKLYGEIQPVPAARVVALEDDAEVDFDGRKLRFLHTRGHANHHFCVYDPLSRAIFTGDSFGLAYPALQSAGPFVFPSTSPTDFDPLEAKKTLKKILQSGAQTAFLTHFGKLTDLPEAARQLEHHLNVAERLLEQSVESLARGETRDLDKELEQELHQAMEQSLRTRGLEPNAKIWELLELDLKLNAQGIAHSARKRWSEASGGSKG